MPKKTQPSSPSPTTHITIRTTDRSGRIIYVDISTGSDRRKHLDQSDTSSWENMVRKLSAHTITWPYSVSRHKRLNTPAKSFGQMMRDRLAMSRQAISRLNPSLISPDIALKKWEKMMSGLREDTLNLTEEVSCPPSVPKAWKQSLIHSAPGAARPPLLSREMYLRNLGLKAEHIPFPTIGSVISVRKWVSHSTKQRCHGRWILLASCEGN